jgi:hypothetical protein
MCDITREEGHQVRRPDFHAKAHLSKTQVPVFAIAQDQNQAELEIVVAIPMRFTLDTNVQRKASSKGCCSVLK